ncbi:ADP-ribosylglycohydrolase family protein [Fusibacter bizertensis]|uniref:ADP-ribosylglycohydrolase family protein n=1 Tax=Fusibacter bizertensis TaxID=1488331 RepID=A0ABT6NA42_9FIRM|nr:ADP-ribosylglycohydrolase family protein [Fusibacter bizertensis]MDH8677275.1 ADP-ribosylglycohydrolase family protein [Fusibacter bizertensis]
MERLKGMLFGAFVADAYALGLHWVYDTEKLSQEQDKLDGFITPSKGSFHFGKRRGEFTHYGDQSLLLLKSISSNNGFSLDVFKTHWLTFMSKYEGYMDHATKETLNTLDDRTHFGSSSDELGGFARVAPLIYYHFDDPLLKKYIEKQTRLTHNNDLVVNFSSFAVDLLLELIIGKPIIETIDKVSENYPMIKDWVEMIKPRLSEDTVTVIKDIGQSCSSQFAIPATLYLTLKYHDNFEEAMKQNVLSGGDSAGRGMVVGMFLGASLGFSKIPPQWCQSLLAYDLINGFTEHKLI